MYSGLTSRRVTQKTCLTPASSKAAIIAVDLTDRTGPDPRRGNCSRRRRSA